ncbi:MAG: DUF2147 domain-containing protein [Bergeyella sp.]|nr:DUF2147 domain-containing protein [Bergeyella sp.]
MKKNVMLTFLFVMFCGFASAQIVGKWKTVDDETGQAKSIVEIYKKSDGKYYGKITELLVKPKNKECVKCVDDRKNSPIVGMEIIRGLKKEGDEYSQGTILNPKNGKIYRCTIKRESGNRLRVRGFIGVSLLGKTQIWEEVKQ